MYKFIAEYDEGTESAFDVHLIQSSQDIRDAWILASRIATENDQKSLVTLRLVSQG